MKKIKQTVIVLLSAVILPRGERTEIKEIEI